MCYRFIFEITIRPEEDEAFITNWQALSKIIQEYPGARGTRIHLKVGQAHTYVAIAEWDNPESRQVALTDLEGGQSERSLRHSLLKRNEDFGDYKLVAELDELTVVLPPHTQPIHKGSGD